MNFYIASSWKNQHGVTMLTEILRQKGHTVTSWIENNYDEYKRMGRDMSFDDWVNSENGEKAFIFDTDGATKCDCLIYYSPAGKDACCELGAAWSKKIPILGLHAKGEDLGLMRRMMHSWYYTMDDLLKAIDYLYSCFNL